MKKTLTMLLALVMALTLVSGAALAQSDGLFTTFDLIASADYQLENANGYEADAKITLDMEAEGMRVGMDMKADIKYLKDPLTMKLGFSMSAPELLDEEIDGDFYIRTEDGAMVMYIAMQGEALRLPILDADVMALITGMDNSSASSYEYVSLIEKTNINGREVYALLLTPNVNLDGNDLTADLLGGLALSELMPGISIEDMVKGMRMTAYIDAKTYQYVRLEADLAQLTNELYAQMGLEAKVHSYKMTIDYKNIGKVKKFDVPNSIIKKAAQNDLSELLEF